MLRPIRRALLSVSDKAGLVEFARDLHAQFGVELVATGGTHKTLTDAGLSVTDVAAVTGFPEVLDGRVKTLHPAVFAGILARRDKPDHLHTLAEHKLPEFDLVVCNLYPFEQTVADPQVTEAAAVEQVDIGGPSLIRAAAKNFAAVCVVVDPADYVRVLLELRTHKGATRPAFRRQLAGAAFKRVAEYDKAISDHFNGPEEDSGGSTMAGTFMPMFVQLQKLRYGENPHQQGLFYAAMPKPTHACVATAETLHGKELSYNNLLDLDAALTLVREFSDPAAVVVKHNNPCGAAMAATLADAFHRAWAGDPRSAFGGIIAVNRPLDEATTAAITADEKFVECVIAPGYEPAALTALKGWKKNVRLLRTGPLSAGPPGMTYHKVDGGLLVQSRDAGADDPGKWYGVTKTQPTPAQARALWFAWLVCKHVKSNAIVLAKGTQVVGVGAGQMSRVDAVDLAVRKAGDRAKGAVLASDAFFPFADNVEAAAAAGVTAIVQPGGSVKDADSIAACDRHGIAMLFTGVRHFRH